MKGWLYFFAFGVLFLSGCATVNSESIKSVPNKDLSYTALPLDSETPKIYRQEFVRRHPEWSEDIKKRVLDGKIMIGMTAQQVRASWGEPARVQKSGSVLGESEIWAIGGHYLYFNNGTLTSYSES